MMNRKGVKFVATLTVLALTLIVFSVVDDSENVDAETQVIDGLRYELTAGDPGTATVLKPEEGSYSGAITIPEEVECNSSTYKVTKINGSAIDESQSAFKASEITSVTINAKNLTIAPYAFYQCAALTTVVFGEGSTGTIEEYAFAGTGITSISIPEGFTSIGNHAFVSCNITTLSITGTQHIGEAILQNSTVGTLNIDGAVTFDGQIITNSQSRGSIGAINLKSTSSTMNVGTFGTGASTTTNSIFAFVLGINTITIDGKVSLGNRAFSQTDVQTITFKANSEIGVIGYRAIYECQNLTSITFEPGVKVSQFESRSIYNNQKLTSFTFPATGEIQINDDKAFAYNGFTSITIPSNVSKIGNLAFYRCGNLVNVTVEEYVKADGFTADTRTVGSEIFKEDGKRWDGGQGQDVPVEGTHKISSFTLKGSMGTTIDENVFSSAFADDIVVTYIGNNYDIDIVPVKNALVSHSVAFTGNYEGSEYSQNVTEYVGLNYAMPNSMPVRDGYSFTGWFTLAEGGVQITTATTVRTDSENQTLYAHWKEVPASEKVVTFISQGSVYTTVLVESGKTVMNPGSPNAPVGNKFTGWYTDEYIWTIDTRFDFTKTITANISLYAGWTDQMTVTLPDEASWVGYTISNVAGGTTGAYNRDFSLDVALAGEYTELKVYKVIGTETTELVAAGSTYSFKVTADTSVKVSVKLGEKTTEVSKTEEVDIRGNTTAITTKVETTEGSATKTITETANTAATGATSALTAEVTATSASVEFTSVTGSDTAVVSESLVTAITDNVAGGDTVTMDITAKTSAVEIPKTAFTDAKISDVTVAVNSGSANEASITLPAGFLAAGDVGQTVSISVTDSPRQADATAAGATAATAAFNLNLEGTATTEFEEDVTVSMAVDLPAGASNVKFYCLDNGTTVPARYANGTATGALPHFSAWAIVYDMPADADVFDDDELPPTWHYVPQQQSSSSNTTMIVAACAAAVAAIAVALVMLNVVRKN